MSCTLSSKSCMGQGALCRISPEAFCGLNELPIQAFVLGQETRATIQALLRLGP